MTNQEAIIEEGVPTEEVVQQQQAHENAKDSWNLWFNSTITQKFLRELNTSIERFQTNASIKAYTQSVVDNNQLTKAETLRKVVDYAKTGNADF